MENKNNKFINLQIYLADAFAERNIQKFRFVLELEQKPIAFADACMRIFEQALKTPGCIEFVEEFIKAGCDPCYVISKKPLIFTAIELQDPQILKALLIKPGVNVNIKSNGLTLLNHLAIHLKAENDDDTLMCMQILLQYGASPNIADNEEMTPLDYIVKNRKIDDLKKQEFIQLFLAQSDLDIDIYRNGELRRILEDIYPEFKLPEQQENHIVTYDTLLTDMRNNDMIKFEQHFMHYSKQIKEQENLDLLIRSVETGAHLAFDLLLASDINYYRTAIRKACMSGNWYALKKLLEKIDTPVENALKCTVKILNKETFEEFCDYWKCFYILLESDKIDIDERDEHGCTALYYAVKYRNNKAVKELLKAGANICVKSYNDELLIDGMDPKVLEEHFNDCITSDDAKFGDENFEILINFKNLIPKKKANLQIIEVMSPIAFMAETKDYRHLLKHPVITSYLFLKWHKISLAFYINFVLYLFYAVSITTHVVLKFKEKDDKTVIAVSVLLSWLGIIYLIIREVLQFIMYPLRYVSSLSNYVEIVLIVLSVMTCKDIKLFDNETQRIIAILTILLADAELYLLVGSLPVSSISTHMLMLEAVCKSFFKSFFLYSIFVITFTICFYIMHDHDDTADENSTNFNNFPNLLMGFLKTIVMLTGELDAANLKLDTFYSQLIFLLFVFFMTIILFNLLNGLAVSDTQTIKDQADLNFTICLIHLLARYEQYNIERANHIISLHDRIFCYYICCFYVNVNKFIVKIFKYFRKLCPDYSNFRQITILPNDNNKIGVPTSPHRDEFSFDCLRTIKLSMDLVEDDEDADMESYMEVDEKCCCFSCITGNCSKMDKRIVKLAMDVLEQKTEERTDQRLQNIENKLEEMLTYMRGERNLNEI